MSYAPPTYENLIKQDLKSMMQMTRVPRSLDIFYYFLHCYRQQEALLNKQINSTLRRKRITKLAPSATVLKEKLKSNTDQYDKYFEAFVVWANKHYDNRRGRARTISGWTDAAVALFSKWSDVQIPLALHKLFYIETRDINTTSINGTLRRASTDDQGQHIDTRDIYNTSINGTLSRSFYHRTRNSYRWYHPDQNLTTEEKREKFRGHFNIDIVSCFPSIWWYDLQGYDCELENAELLCPEHKARLIEIIKRDFNVSDNKRAKQIRTKLTSSKRHRTEKTGVLWFDKLRDHIIDKTLKWGEHNLPEGLKLTVHNVFTYLEWQIVDRMLEAGNEALLMHDGIIFSELDKKKLVGRAWPHQVTIDTYH